MILWLGIWSIDGTDRNSLLILLLFQLFLDVLLSLFIVKCTFLFMIMKSSIVFWVLGIIKIQWLLLFSFLLSFLLLLLVLLVLFLSIWRMSGWWWRLNRRRINFICLFYSCIRWFMFCFVVYLWLSWILLFISFTSAFNHSKLYVKKSQYKN